MAAFIYKQYKTARTVFCLLFITLLAGFSGSIHAQTNPVYTVEGVEVDVTAENAVKAREKALNEAQVKAYQMLAERLLGPEELKTFQVPDADTVSLLVQDFEVTNEQLSRVRYKGVYTIRFRPNAMKTQMASQGRSYSDQIKKPVLILPYFQNGDEAILWGEGNPWMSAWRALPTDKNMLQPTVLPLGDAADLSDIGDDQIMTYDPMQLQDMANRYNADDAALLLANLVPSPTGKKLIVTIYKHGFEGPVFVQKVDISSLPVEEDSVFLARAAAKVKGLIRQDWKNNAAFNQAQVQTTTTTTTMNAGPPPLPYTQQALGPATIFITHARFASVQDWVKLKGALDRTRGVQSVLVKALKPREAMLDIRFAGNVNQLQSSLQGSGIILRATSANAPVEIYLNSYQRPTGY